MKSSLDKQKDDPVKFLGKSIASLVFLIGAFLFLGFVWPAIIGVSFFFPLVVCFLPVLPSNFLADEFDVKNKVVLMVIAYIGLAITSFIYLTFFVDGAWWIKLLHLVVYSFFVFLFLRIFVFEEEES